MEGIFSNKPNLNWMQILDTVDENYAEEIEAEKEELRARAEECLVINEELSGQLNAANDADGIRRTEIEELKEKQNEFIDFIKTESGNFNKLSDKKIKQLEKKYNYSDLSVLKNITSDEIKYIFDQFKTQVTKSKKKVVGLDGYGIKITKQEIIR